MISKIKNYLLPIGSLLNSVNIIETRNRYKQLFLTSENIGVSESINREAPIIVTLTSYGNKLYQTYLAIESIMHQTLKPDKITLWLDCNKYSNYNSIPLTLRKQEERGLTIELCKDVRSHTKLVPALLKYPNAVLISIDDDIIYPIDFIERLVRAYEKDPSKIYFYRGHHIIFKRDGSPDSYLSWVKKGAQGSSLFNFPTGVGGILYPPNCFHEDVTNEKLFLKMCPHADDVWFKVMSYLKEIECEKIDIPNYDQHFIPIDIDVDSSLQKINVINGGNDKQIKEVFKYYNIESD